MKPLSAAHERLVHSRRVRVIARHVAGLLPRGATVLDVGSGDGRLAERLASERPDLIVRGIDSLVREDARVPTEKFDGAVLPYPDRTFDAALLVDVVHHAEHPVALLSEAARVARTLVVKDHLLEGALAGPTLQLMDVVGNAPHGVALPYHYWRRSTWQRAFERLGLRETARVDRLGLYPPPFDRVFERGLHFLAALDCTGATRGVHPRALAWELAYEAFETDAEEVWKFTRRLEWAGAPAWPRDARIAELFCGRGNGLVALERLGFRDLHGVDLSPDLLARYRGGAQCRVADCRALPFRDATLDVVVVQGGLHHLPDPDHDLARVLAEVRRVLRPGGTFVMVEPWLTPFLRVVHAACASSFVRLAYPRLDALATMIRYERDTYSRWLDAGAAVSRAVDATFAPVRSKVAWGKWSFVGTPRGAATSVG